MKNWMQFLSEQSGSRWKYHGGDIPNVSSHNDSQITSHPIEPDIHNTVDQPGAIPSHGADARSSDDKISWLDNMIKIMNAKRMQQMELNSKINNRLGRLEKAVKLPPPINNYSGGMEW